MDDKFYSSAALLALNYHVKDRYTTVLIKHFAKRTTSTADRSEVWTHTRSMQKLSQEQCCTSTHELTSRKNYFRTPRFQHGYEVSIDSEYSYWCVNKQQSVVERDSSTENSTMPKIC